MRMMDELRPLFLYSANKKVYVPMDEKDRKRGAAILLLTPSMEVSNQLMRLPYIVNPSLFRSFYIDRNVTAYIDHTPEDILDFDENQEQSLSEAMIRTFGGKTKFKFDDNMSMMDMRYLKKLYTPNRVLEYANLLGLSHIPEEISVKVYPNLNVLRDSYHGKGDKENIYYYVREGQIHLLSNIAYDERYMYGPYDMYLTSALACCIMASYNSELNLNVVYAIAAKVSGLADWMEENSNSINLGSSKKILPIIMRMTKNNMGYKEIARYLKTNDIKVFGRFTLSHDMRELKKLIFDTGFISESSLSYYERQRLLPSQFGVPDKRKYPLHDEEHVRLAIKMFNSCDSEDEEELAKSIIKAIEKFGITDIHVGDSNNFKKYYKKSKIYAYTARKIKSTRESAIDDNPECANYEDVSKICNSLSPEELKRITFSDKYHNSPFVIKRIIHKVDDKPAGFLDVYQFPSKPQIAQIVLAVDDNYRDMGIANSMVRDMLSCDLAFKHKFNTYYWTAHNDNYASMALATKNGFKDTNELDKYGRKIFVKVIDDKNVDRWNENPSYLKSEIKNGGFSITENAFTTEDMILFTEGDESKYSSRLKKYLFRERMKNSKDVIKYYDRIRQMNPDIDKTYLKLPMYKRFNLFVDLSYYHAIFLRKNALKLDRAVNFYFDFINRLIDNKEINEIYKKQTIFIPVDAGVWPIQPASEIFDFRKNLNPISIIMRLIRTNPGALRKAWGNRDIIFVGSRGYFKVDFNNFDMRNINRFKKNITKLMSVNEPIVDDFEIDEVDPVDADRYEFNSKNSTKKAIAMKMIDSIERDVGISINNVSALYATNKTSSIDTSSHLKINTGLINFDKLSPSRNGNIAIITIDPDGPDGYDKINISKTEDISTYCMPN